MVTNSGVKGCKIRGRTGGWFHQMNTITQVEQAPNYGISLKAAERAARERKWRRKT